jgi:competence protein ComEC
LIAQLGLAARWPPEADGQDVALVGWIDQLPVRGAGRTVFSMRVVKAPTGVRVRRARLSWYDPAPVLAAGQSLEIQARLRSPHGLANPGGFDYERWLFLQRFDATGYVREGQYHANSRFSLGQLWLRCRARLVERIERLIENSDSAVLIQALALGERGGFEDRHWRVLQRTGTSHLVAVSGLHIGMIAALSYFFALRSALWLPYSLARRAHAFAAGMSILAATFYAALAGFTLPTQRALVMLLVVQALVIARRRWPLGSGLALAAILVVCHDPLATLTASFWLSFGAVMLLLAASAEVEHPRAEDRSGLMMHSLVFFRLQWALTLGLAPFVVWFFGQFSLISLLVNLVAIPLFAIVVVPLALTTALFAMIDSDGFGLAGWADSIVAWVWRLLEYAAGGHFAAVELPRPSLLILLLGLVAIAMSMMRHRLPGRTLALFGLIPLALDHSESVPPGFARATVFDVGHGLAVGIETAEHRLLFDSGPAYRSGFDAGEEVVVPALQAISRNAVDLLIVSHGDSDHAGGVAAIIAEYPDMAVLAGPDVDQVQAERCHAGQSWRWDQVQFNVLHPPDQSDFSGNDSSCVVLIETSSGSLLLTGDIESPAESRLTANYELAADVVVVPHHGSLTSSTVPFVKAVDPAFAVVSAGFNNRWNFPRPDVRHRWAEVGADVLVTGDSGAITIDFRADGITVSARRDSRRRYWQAKPEPDSGAVDVSAL